MRRLGVATIFGLLCALARPAHAGVDLAIGTKWTPINYTQPVSTTGAGMPDTVLSGWNTTNLGSYLGAFILDGRLGFQLGLDFGYSSRHDESSGLAKTDLSFSQFGFSLGSKFYITRPRASRVSPYVYLDFFKYFAQVSTSATVPSGYQDYVAGLASPLGIDLAAGAEYFFTRGFSIGAEVLGLKYAYTEGDYSVSAVGVGNVSQTNHYVTFYTGISLNYRFAIGAHHEPAPEPEAIPQRPRPAPPPAPSTEPPLDAPPPAESVD